MNNHTRSGTRLPTLHQGELTVELAPSIGGSIARFYSETENGPHHWLRPATDDAIAGADAEGMASFPLLPFCNRLRNGRAFFQGQSIKLPPNRDGSPHAIHGFGWQSPWTITHQDSRSAKLAFRHAGGDWPFPFLATQSFELVDGRLDVTIDVENQGARSMPIGVGHHPYLPRRRCARLCTAVDAMWAADEDVMPTGLERPPLIDALRQGVRLSGVVQDNNFIGWNHVARVEWPTDDGNGPPTSLTLHAAPPLDFFVLYSPAEEDFFCIEAVSNCTDWLNLAAYPRLSIGGSVIAAGEVAHAHFSLIPDG